MTNTQDEEARQCLIDNLFSDYPPEKARELADRALQDLDRYRELEEGYDPEQEDAKRHLAERVKNKIRSIAGLQKTTTSSLI
jgi:hypothetical protein